METLFSVVDLLCSQNPRNCRQNEKGSHGLSIKIKAVASTRKEYSFWIGGSILVSLSTRGRMRGALTFDKEKRGEAFDKGIMQLLALNLVSRSTLALNFLFTFIPEFKKSYSFKPIQ
ncbi:uncharacterized protein LOC128293095 [Gossypium arboreum]|uniref:uncharacterized protein LOC128293095 n=1 Tax=Gossypium arboreum TaxID=29729 RepID=UPI0022F15E1B|nr:uncharacterized protein LOC128293095 [Gossypium arboreum]